MTALRTEPPGPGRLRPYELPAVRRTRLANGLTVMRARHGGSGLVTVLILLDAGTIRETPAQAGLATLTAETLDTGAAGRAGDELAWELERLGIELETEASFDAAWISATIEVSKLDAALGLLADVVRRPDFPPDEVRRLRNEQLAEILQRSKDPRALASDMILRFLYGDDAAYGRPVVGLAERVSKLERDDVIAFHARNAQPARTAVVLVGDLDEDAGPAAVERAFGDWRAADASPALPPDAPAPRPPAVHIVDRPGAVQSEIRAAHAGVARRHPDYYPLRVLNTILGGAFTSRLNLSLRERHGFTYGVRSGFAFRRAPGPFSIQTAVATDVTARAVEEILNEVNKLRDGGVTGEEVANARDYMAGVLPLELQTTQQIATRLAELALHDLPEDDLRYVRERIQAVSVDDVNRVAREHLRPADLTWCIAGSAAEVRPLMEASAPGPLHVHASPERNGG